MLIVCTAWVAGESCDVFRAIIPPAGAILARVRSFLPPVCDLLVRAGSEVVVVVREVVVVVSWRWTDCHSPVAVLKRI